MPNGVVTFLKKAGQIILKGAEIFTGFAPLITATIPNSAGVVQTISKDLAEVATAVTDVEAFGQALSLPGPQKLVAATPKVAQIILDSAILAGKPVANQALFMEGAGNIADGMAKILNSIHPDAATQLKPQDVKTV